MSYRVAVRQTLRKYAGCPRDTGGGKSVRMLSQAEIEEFQRVISIKIARKERAAGARLDVAASCTAGELAKTPNGHSSVTSSVKRHPKNRASAASRRCVV
jgi:hypothetical protein